MEHTRVTTEPTFFRWLGTVDYAEAWEMQKRARDGIVEAKRADPPLHRPHVIYGVQHPPVFTLGKSADPANLLADAAVLERIGATSIAIDRGGDITYHGPGQLVVYPILDLDRIFTDLGRYLRSLEEAVIATLAHYGIDGVRIEGRTGVWVGPDEFGAERKICAMGIHCSRWVTSHGLALNVNTDLDYFSHIVPCGIADRGVTSIKAETGLEHDVPDVCDELVRRLGRILNLDIRAA